MNSFFKRYCHSKPDRKGVSQVLLLVVLMSGPFTFVTSKAQEPESQKGFGSVFQQASAGSRAGTVNGLVILDQDGTERLLDFQAGKATLDIIKARKIRFDATTKAYIGSTTSGRTKVKYVTQGQSNEFGILLGGQWFEVGDFEATRPATVPGIEYKYSSETSAEYLNLYFNQDVELDNWGYLLETEGDRGYTNRDELVSKRKKLKVKARSSLVFAIQRD